MPKPSSTLTPETIVAHERLYPRVAALLKQIERVAAPRPMQPVPAESVKLARELCQEAAQLLGKEGRGIAAPPPWRSIMRASPWRSGRRWPGSRRSRASMRS